MTFTADTAERRPPKLPFWSTVGRAYAATFMSFGSLMRAGWLWLLVLAPALAVLAWFQVPLQAANLARQGTAPTPADEVWQLWLLTTLQQIATVPAMASIAVAWHRLIIMGERPARAYFRLDRGVWLYAGFLLAWCLSFTAPGLLLDLMASEPAAQVTAGILTLVVIIAGGLIMGRLSLVLPPIALGRTDIGLGEAWRATRDNSWKLFLGPVVCVLFMGIPGYLAIKVTAADRPIATVVMTAFYLFALLGGVFAVGFLSFAYQHFLQREPRRTD